MRRKTIAVIVLVSLGVLTACGSPDEKAKANAERAVAAKLRDPDSARFSDEFVVRQKVNSNNFVDLATCGVVDGKNLFGAYTGGARFVAVQSESDKYNVFDTSNVILEENHDGAPETYDAPQMQSIFELVYWNAYCVDATHPKSYTGERR